MFAVAPVALVNTTVRPFEFSVAILLVVYVTPGVNSAVAPLENSFAIHFIIFPLASEFSAVRPLVGPAAVDLVIKEFPYKLRVIRPYKSAHTVLFTKLVAPVVGSAIGPHFLA